MDGHAPFFFFFLCVCVCVMKLRRLLGTNVAEPRPRIYSFDPCQREELCWNPRHQKKKQGARLVLESEVEAFQKNAPCLATFRSSPPRRGVAATDIFWGALSLVIRSFVSKNLSENTMHVCLCVCVCVCVCVLQASVDVCWTKRRHVPTPDCQKI